MPYFGWIEMTFQLASVTVQAEELMVSVIRMTLVLVSSHGNSGVI